MKREVQENVNAYVFTSRFMLNEGSPIVFVSHDDDGDWQFLGTESNLSEEDAMIVSLGEILEYDPTLLSIMDLPVGKEASRISVDDKWNVR